MGYSASDLERWSYCHLSWWLSRGGVRGEGDEIAGGVEAHAAKGDHMSVWRRLLAAHKEALTTAFHLGVVAAAAATLAIEVTFLDYERGYNILLMLLSLLWLFVALIFLGRAMKKEKQAAAIRRDAGFVIGDPTYSDLDRPGTILRSKKYDLGGRPDYMVRRDGHLIPVEVKTGKTPKHPHDSHVLQVATYCVLVEEVMGERPPYGILTYEDAHFEIPYTEDLKDKVLRTVLEMRLAEVTQKVHRSHDRPGKCRGCSRRHACAERLDGGNVFGGLQASVPQPAGASKPEAGRQKE
ncbi:MAG TPA: CRISPR-associated protein Cas4 [Candidatus Thermoplasmatota archaeon]|nr:CRISPR-associated protein Cas4 [Candidatus Thermoplasmatota archaeon]